ncbi:MAG: hypothetical protein WD042_06895 [Phycisphaeraceae bacterium]
MTKRIWSIARLFLWGGLLSAPPWVARAVLLLAIFALLHLLGWRADTAIISGTLPAPGVAGELAILRGLLYVLSYFAAVLVAPILLIAAVLLTLMQLGPRRI